VGSAIGGLVRRWEMDQRSIRHAVAVAMTRAAPLGRGVAGDATTAVPAGGTIPMGTLFAIPGDV
jgi:hypothetical protein